MNRLVDTETREQGIDLVGCQTDKPVEAVGKPRADDIERHPEHQSHDGDESRNGGVFAGQNTVDFKAAQMFFAGVRLNDGLRTDVVDETEAHVGDGRGAVQPSFGFKLLQNVLDRALFINVKMKLFGNERIALGDFACGKTKRNAGLLSMILNEKHQAVQTAMYRPTMIVGRTEVVDCRCLDKPSGMQGVLNELFDALSSTRRNRHDRNAQQRFHFIDANGTAIGSHLIHHVQGQNHGTAEFHELQREIHVALDVGGVDDVDDDVRIVAKDELARDDFFVGVWR